MRILMIGEYKPRVEGPANVVINLSYYLSKEHQVSVVCFENPMYKNQPGHKLDGRVDVWQERIIWPNTFVIPQGIVQKLKRAYLLRKKVDIYHAHGYLDALVGLLDRSRPLVITYHGLPIQESLAAGSLKKDTIKLRILQMIEKAVLRRADAIIILNNRLKEWMLSEQGVEPSKLIIIPNGADIDKFNPHCAREPSIGSVEHSDHRTIIFVKSLNEQSGVRYLVQSMTSVKEQFPDVQLLLVGEGSIQEEMKILVNKMGLADNVRFIGRVPNDHIPTYLNDADVYVLPSIPQGEAEETFSLSLIEAMACGKAVIATGIGGSKEILSAEKDIGVLIPPKDSEAIANAVLHFFKNPSLIFKYGENAKNFVESRLTWKDVVAQTLIVYECVLVKHLSD